MKKNSDLHSDKLNYNSERIQYILNDFIETEKILAENNINNIIAFFGSARILPKELAQEELNQAKKQSNQKTIDKAINKLEISKYYEDATTLSKKLSLWAKNLKTNKYYVCSGGGPGIMEAANKGAYLANHPSLGFNITLPYEQGSNQYVTKELIFNFKYFFVRKFWFAYLAKAIIIFPGGFGTLDELFEILTLIQTNKIEHKIPIVIFGSKFFNQLGNIETMLKYSLINEQDYDMFITTDNIEEAFNYITTNLLNNN